MSAAQLDYERAKGRLDGLNAVAAHLPPTVLREQRRLRLDELKEAQRTLLATRHA